MAHKKKGKTSDWPHELRWHFGQVSRVDEMGAIQPMQGKDIGGDELQRAFQPDILQSMTEGARALIITTLENALHNTAIDCDQILRKKGVAGYHTEPKLFSSEWYRAGEPPQYEDGFVSPTDDAHEIAAPRRYYDHIKPFTAESYAGETLERCRKLLWFFKAPSNRRPSSFNDIENLLMTALETGRLIAEAEWRQGFKDSILKYLNSREAGANSLDGFNAEQRFGKDERQFEIEGILRKTKKEKGALVRHIRRHLFEQGFLSRSKDFHFSSKTIQRDLKEIEERQKQR